MGSVDNALGVTEERRVWPDRDGENLIGGLIRLCEDWVRPDFVMVEVGCYAGVSTVVFARHARKVYAVDAWGSVPALTGYRDLTVEQLQEAERRFDERMKGFPNVEKVRELSVPASARFSDGSLDAIYLDGDHWHQAFHADVVAWLLKLKNGGLLMGHDHPTVGCNFRALRLPTPAQVYSETSWVMVINNRNDEHRQGASLIWRKNH